MACVSPTNGKMALAHSTICLAFRPLSAPASKLNISPKPAPSATRILPGPNCRL